jgi:peptidoglycan/xylan/chitin deacetylase (PgdA/CDA1 family)
MPAVSPSATDPPRLTVALTFDHDSLSDGVRRGDSPVKMSHAEFGHRVGVPRILELLERESIRSSWFIPGHTLETYPQDTDAILAGDHEVGCHGWFHEDFSTLDVPTQRSLLERSMDAVARFTGASARGHRAPYWELGADTLELIEGAGFLYDSSLMADDYRPYRIRHGDRHSVEEGTKFGPEGRLIEVPVYWTFDDWPMFEPDHATGRDGMAAPSQVLEIWTAELLYAYEHAPGGLLTITMHPECIGRGHRMAMLETFIAEAKSHDGVVFDRLDTYLERWRQASTA